MPVAVFLLGAAFGLEEMSYKMLSIMSVISVGVIVASIGEITISWVGVVYQMGGVVAEALRLIFIEIFLKKKGVKLNLISMMYYVSPCRYLIHMLFLLVNLKVLAIILMPCVIFPAVLSASLFPGCC